MGSEAAFQSEQALVWESAQVLNAAVKLLLERVELRMNVAHSLGLLNNRAVLLTQLELHVRNKVGEAGLKVGRADCETAQITDVAAKCSLHGIHIHAEQFKNLAQNWREALLCLEGRIEHVGRIDG